MLLAALTAFLTVDPTEQRPRPPSAPSPDEQALIRRAAGGDPLAFRRLFEEHAPSLRRFLGDLLRDDAAADEATQETFVRAHARLASLRDGEKLLPWLFGIGRRVYLGERRARRRQPLTNGAPPPDEADLAPTPEGILLGRESNAQLDVALASLDEERRAALVLRLDHGLDYAEIGAVMSWSPAKVKNELHRARLELRTRLQKYVGGV